MLGLVREALGHFDVRHGRAMVVVEVVPSGDVPGGPLTLRSARTLVVPQLFEFGQCVAGVAPKFGPQDPSRAHDRLRHQHRPRR